MGTIPPKPYPSLANQQCAHTSPKSAISQSRHVIIFLLAHSMSSLSGLDRPSRLPCRASNSGSRAKVPQCSLGVERHPRHGQASQSLLQKRAYSRIMILKAEMMRPVEQLSCRIRVSSFHAERAGAQVWKERRRVPRTSASPRTQRPEDLGSSRARAGRSEIRKIEP